MAAATPTATRDRKPSMGAPISQLQGPVGPGFSRPKHKRTATGLAPSEIKSIEAAIPEPQRAAWQKYSATGFKTKDEFEKEVVKHIETTLARSLFNCDES